MFFPIIDFKNDNIESFIQQWSSFYNYNKMNLYTHNIDKKVLGTDDLIALYVWKNGSNLSANKSKSLEDKILSKIDRINELKQNFNIVEFRNKFRF